MSKKHKIRLKPYDIKVIQVCPICHKVDSYLGDRHRCGDEINKSQDKEMS
jgi:hypothetical protein